MKLELLLNREPFDEIFTKTLSSYLKKMGNWDGVIAWKRNTCSLPSALRVNPDLNILYPGNLDKRELRLMTMEFSFHPSLLRRFIQKLYVRFATTKFLEKLTSTACVEIFPWPKQLDQVCVIPGNHSIRLIDIGHDSCDVIVKDGFDMQFIRNQIQIRKKFTFLPTPKLIDHDESGGWYREQRIVGMPWNRIKDQHVQQKALQNVWPVLQRLYAETCNETSIQKWSESLTGRIENVIELLPAIFSRETRNRISSIVRQLETVVIDQTMPIRTVTTHGDFQPANIMLSVDGTEQYWIIDWEYADHRIDVYDALVFITQCRFPAGLSSRLNALLSVGVSTEHKQLFSFETLNNGADVSSPIIAIFLLEDILLRLKENCIPQMRNINPGLFLFFDEVEKIKWKPV